MAHFAKVSSENIVEQVIVVRNEDMTDELGNESEDLGKEFISSIGLEGRWIQTSYNHSFRGRYASIGMVYSEETDEFIFPTVEVTE